MVPGDRGTLGREHVLLQGLQVAFGGKQKSDGFSAAPSTRCSDVRELRNQSHPALLGEPSAGVEARVAPGTQDLGAGELHGMEETLEMAISWMSITLRQMSQRPTDFSALCSSMSCVRWELAFTVF